MKQNNELFEQIADALVDDGFIIIPNALNPSLSKNLKEIAQNISSYKQATISSQKVQDYTKRRDKIKWIDEDESYQSEYLQFMHGLQNFLNQSLYLGLNYYESHFAIYDKDDFYEKHCDAFKAKKTRIVTSVYYLNDSWSKEDGGELVIYDDENNHLINVIPHSNTLVIFLSEKFPHEVLPSKKKRFSIAGWFRVDK